MDLLNAAIDAVTVMTAHVMIGLFSAPMKYKRRVSVLLWCVWGALQAILFIPATMPDVSPNFGFVAGFVAPYVGQYVLFFLTTKGKPTQRLFTILTYSVFFCIYMGITTAVIGSFPDLHWGFATLIRTEGGNTDLRAQKQACNVEPVVNT